MKSYASAVSKSCSEAFAPKRIQTVVRNISVMRIFNRVIVFLPCSTVYKYYTIHHGGIPTLG